MLSQVIQVKGINGLCVCVFSYSVVSDSVTPWTVTYQGFSVHGSFQARIPEWIAISYSIIG